MSHKNAVAVPDKIEHTDWRGEIGAWVGSKLLMLGLVVTLVATAMLVYYAAHFSTAVLDAKDIASAEGYITTFRGLLIGGLLVFATGMTFSFWGDYALPLTLFLVAVLYYFSPELLPYTGLVSDISVGQMEQVAATAMNGLRLSGLILGIAAILLQLVDATFRIKNRSKYGAKGDQMKYGKGVKEEVDYQNVFMGKCWQLPFCRKFVRERCPIYHSRRTCWRERVGCMCEEEVIRGALEGKTIPRDVVAAAKFIPYNSRITPAQKAERCRQCVIYNEHQRHKYRLAIPTVFAFVAAVYVLFHTPLMNEMNVLLRRFDVTMSKIAFTTEGPAQPIVTKEPGTMEEILLILLMLFVISQIMRVVEFGIFKLKV